MPGGHGKVKSSHFSLLYFVHLEVEGLGVSALRVSKPKLLSLWYSESSDNVEGERDLSLFKEGITSDGDEHFEGWT